MKTAFLCAIILSQIAAEGRELVPVKATRCVSPSAGVVVLAPVAEMTNSKGQTVEGVFVRVATAPKPLQMINPLAPPEYGAAGNLVTYSSDANRTDNPNKPVRFQATGIRLFTLRPIW